jgi:glycosyltransferase involved in cell wall biosynthesis
MASMSEKPGPKIEELSTDESALQRRVLTSRRRIGFAIETLDVGGAEVHAVSLAEFLQQQGWEVSFAVMREARGPLPERCRRSGIHVEDRLMSSRRGRSVIQQFRRCAADREFDTLFVVECFYINALFGYRAAKRERELNAYAIIHNWPSKREFTHPALAPIRTRLMRRIFRNIVFIADSQRTHYEETLGIQFDETVVIPSGIDVNRFTPVSFETDKTSTTEFDRNSRVAIVASLTPRKGHEYFLQAASMLLRSHPGVEFLIVGDGPRRDELERMAFELEISGHVEFLGVREDLPSLLQTVDAVVLASHEIDGRHAETLPLVLLEAGAAAVPVVATRVGAVPEIVIDERTGYLVEPRDPDAIARAVAQILDDPAHAHEMGAIARERIIAKYNAPRMNERFEQLFLTGR